MNSHLTQYNFQYIFYKGEKYDKQTLQTGIDQLAQYLQSRINFDSPFILFTAYNHIKTVISYYAILKVGKIAVILDPELKEIEISEIIGDVDPAAIILLNNKNIPFNFEDEIIFRKSIKEYSTLSDLKDVCTISYTNAEDGYSKGAMLTEKNLLYEIDAIIKTNHLTKDSVTCALLPFSHLYGFVHGVLLGTHSGASSLITEANILHITETVNDLSSYKITHLHTVPSIYYVLGKVPGILNLCYTIKDFYSGGIKLSEFIFLNFYNKTNRKIREGYGLTEGSPAVAGNYQQDDPVFGSFGKPFPGCKIQIIDINGNECRIGDVGEICVSGDAIFKGYLNHENTTKKILKNSWLYTGDLGKKDENGYIYFCGLKKEMINIAGNKVYPKKLERLIKLNKNVLDVDIFSEESILQGNTIGAKIKLKNNSLKSQQEIKGWCQQNINNTMLPKNYLFL